MKTAALGRGKAKDAYDIYFLVKHYHTGVLGLAGLFEHYRWTKTIVEKKQKLGDKFASPDHAGPTDVANFIEPENEEERELIKRDAYEQIHALLELI